MNRIAFFVDGSNLFGALKHLGVLVDDYESFYRFIFDKAAEEWRQLFSAGNNPHAAQLLRVYWYVVGQMDRWDLAKPEAKTRLRGWFDADQDVKKPYMALVGPKHPGVSQEDLADKAWAACFQDFRQWYEAKAHLLDGMLRFYDAVRMRTDCIDIIEGGRWKVDLLHRNLDEKGLDASLAVDMVALKDTYDVAVVISGDADMIPAINYVKTSGNHVAAVEFLKGSPPEKKGKQFSLRLRRACDFVVQIYETELIQKGLAKKGDVDKSLDQQQNPSSAE